MNGAHQTSCGNEKSILNGIVYVSYSGEFVFLEPHGTVK